MALPIACAEGRFWAPVRHKGFIPWDDDIDLMMPRDDYERLRDLARKEPVADFLVHRYPGDAHYPYGFAKIVDTKTVIYERNITDDGSAMGWRWTSSLWTGCTPWPGKTACCLRASSSGIQGGQGGRRYDPSGARQPEKAPAQPGHVAASAHCRLPRAMKR